MKTSELSKLLKDKEWMDKATPEGRIPWSKIPNDSVAYWGFVNDKLIPNYVCSNTQCHAGLHDQWEKHNWVNHIDKAEYMFNFVTNMASISKEVREKFFKWLHQESPYSCLYKNSYEDFCETNIQIIDMDYNANFIASACAAARFPSEHPERASMWLEFVEAGIHGGLAFIFSNNFLEEGDGTFCECANIWHNAVDRNSFSLSGAEVFLYGPKSEFYKEDTLKEGSGYWFISAAMTQSLGEYDCNLWELLDVGKKGPRGFFVKPFEGLGLFLGSDCRSKNKAYRKRFGQRVELYKVEDLLDLEEKILMKLGEYEL